MTKDEVLEELCRLRRDEQVEVLEFLDEIIALPSKDEEGGLVEAIDEADRGDLVDGPAAINSIRESGHGT